MKITAIEATNRRKGNTVNLCKKILDGAGRDRHETQILNLYDYNIRNCIGCWKCVGSNQCILKDDFAKLYEEVRSSDCIIIGTPCYWSNVPGVLKTFIDRHTGYAMKKPDNADEFHKLNFIGKIKMLKHLSKDFGPEEAMRNKKFIFVIPMTLPFPVSHLSGDLTTELKALKIYVKKMKGTVAGKIIYTDTLFQFNKNKKMMMMKKAYRLGLSLNR
jgi:putative NADPH-quinone reductase